MERTCKKCGETKPIEQFERSNGCKFGYNYRCIDCKRRIAKENQKIYRQENKEKNRLYYENNKERILNYSKEYFKIYYQNNKERLNIKHMDYYHKNREMIRDYYKRYYKDKKDPKNNVF